MGWLRQQADVMVNSPLIQCVDFNESQNRLDVRVPSLDRNYRSIAIFFAWSSDAYTTESPMVRVAYSLNDGLPGESLVEIEAYRLEVALWLPQPNLVKVIEEIAQRLVSRERERKIA